MPIVYLNDDCNCHKTPCFCREHSSSCGCDACNPPTQCTSDNGCPILLDSTCVIYNKFGGESSGLTYLELPNGSTLEFILETLDDYLGTLSAYTFPPFVTTCIGVANTTITTLSDFMEAVDDQFCEVKQNLNTLNGAIINNFNSTNNLFNDFNHPEITSTCVGLTILDTDDVKTILTKLKDAYCSLYTTTINDQSPDFEPINSNSISWFLAGTKGHKPTASIKQSAQPGNVLQVLADGLFVGQLPALSQTISYNPTTNTITLSGGGGSVTLPTYTDTQTLSLNTSTNVLSISNGNAVDFTSILPTFSQVAINPVDSTTVNMTANGTANTNISADVIISPDSGNSLVAHSNGLFVPTPVADTDELVKASAAGTAGTLIQKTEGCVNGSATTTVAYNSITDKLTICTAINAGTLLTEISSTPALLTQFIDMVKDGLCFKFRLLNTNVASQTYGYTACDGTVTSGLSIAPSAVVEVCGTAVTTSSNDVYVFNLGYC